MLKKLCCIFIVLTSHVWSADRYESTEEKEVYPPGYWCQQICMHLSSIQKELQNQSAQLEKIRQINEIIMELTVPFDYQQMENANVN